MQELKIYVTASSAVGTVRDFVNARNAALPPLVRGVGTLLKIRLFETADGATPYPVEKLQEISAWRFVIDRDWDSKTSCIIQADHENITVSRVRDAIGDLEYNYTEIAVPLVETNTVELEEFLGGSASRSGLTAELCGYDAEGRTAFVLQLENLTVRNRLTGAGDPTELPTDYWSEAQVRAFITNYVDTAVENAVRDELANGEW